MINVLHIASSRFESNVYEFLFDNLNYYINQKCIVPWPINEKIKINITDNTIVIKSKYNMLYGQYIIKVIIMYYHIKKYIDNKSVKYDIIHAHYLFYDGHVAYKLKKYNKKKYIITIRNTDLNILKKKPYLKYYAKKILKDADSIIFISKIICNKFINMINESDEYYAKIIIEKSYIIPNGVDDYWIDNKSYKNKYLTDNINILTVGWIQKNKNQLSVAKAISRINKEKGYKIKYTIIGDIRDVSYYKKLRKYDFIEFKSRMKKENLIKYYRKSDIFAMPSFNETFGLVYIEALTQNLPIIYTKNQGVDGIFKNNNIGISVNPKNVSEIKASIEEIINKYDKYVNNKNKNDYDEYRWEKIAKIYNDIYTSIKI